MNEEIQEYIEDVKEKTMTARTGYTSPQRIPTVREALAKNGPVTTWPAIPMLRDRIRWLRKRDGMTQVEFGRKVGVAGNSISQWESGRNRPEISRISKISEFTGCPLTWLRGTTQNTDYEKSTPENAVDENAAAIAMQTAESAENEECGVISLRGDRTGNEIASLLRGLLPETKYHVTLELRW